VPVVDGTRVSIARPFSRATSATFRDFAAILEEDGRRERIFARADYASLPPSNDFFVRVFINRADADASTPTSDPHYAGSFAFFGTQGHEHGRHTPKTDFLVNVTDTLQRLRAQGVLGESEPISVQLVAVPIGPRMARADAELTLERLDLIVSPVGVRADPG
jgi:tyrosinase